MGLGIFGYVECRRDSEHDWESHRELGTLPNAGGLWYSIAGVGKQIDGHGEEPLAEERGIPEDASVPVKNDYEGQKQENPVHGGTYRTMFGHTYILASELDERDREMFDVRHLVEKFGENNVRIILWFNR